jgi:hypothetical protein
MLLYNPFKSLTIWGTIQALWPLLVAAFDPHALSPMATTALSSLGILIGALGLRNAHAKGVATIADLVQQLAAKK